jgi:hypothetical protein
MHGQLGSRLETKIQTGLKSEEKSVELVLNERNTEWN